MLDQLKSRARALKNETFAVYIAAKDPRTPWYAKAIAICILAYALSPIDLIPDFVPVLGYLDDIIIVPAGIMLAIRLIPADALAEAREKAAQAQGPERSLGIAGMMIIMLLWALSIAGAVYLIIRLMEKV